MSCSPFDLRDYFLKELPEVQGRQVESHVRGCQGCREELERLRLTEAALASLGEEEIPQRIAFVSDQVFEPAWWRRWWTAFWGSGARLGFASASVLAGAIVFHGLNPPRQVAMVPRPSPAVVERISDADMQVRIDRAVAKAVARQTEETRQLIADLESTRRRLLIAASENTMVLKRADTLRVAAYSMPPEPGGELK